MLEFELLQADARAELGESPVWDAETGDLWWVDIPGQRLFRRSGDSGLIQGWDTPEQTGFVVLTADGGVALGMETGIYAFDAATGGFQQMLSLDRPGCRFNDATVDGQGRLWASVMHLQAEPGQGALFRVAADLTLVQVASGLTIPNGLAHDAGAGRLFYSDSFVQVQTIWTAPLDSATASLGPAQVFADTTSLPGRPDGAAMDAAGNYWIAGVDGAEIYVFAPDGQLAKRLPTPFDAPTKPGFAGPEGRRVALTSKQDAGQGGVMALADLPSDWPAGVAPPCWRPGG